jgi:hypothetical protein
MSHRGGAVAASLSGQISSDGRLMARVVNALLLQRREQDKTWTLMMTAVAGNATIRHRQAGI